MLHVVAAVEHREVGQLVVARFLVAAVAQCGGAWLLAVSALQWRRPGPWTLLAGLAGEAQMGFDDEGGAGRLQACGQGLPRGQLEHQAQVRHRDQVVADLAGVGGREGCAQVQRNLVAEEVEVDPGRGAAPLAATQHAAVEGARGRQIVHVVGEMKQAAHRRALRFMAS